MSEFEVKYEIKGDDKNRTYRKRIEAKDAASARNAFKEYAATYFYTGTKYLITGVRDVTNEPVTLEVKDVYSEHGS